MAVRHLRVISFFLGNLLFLLPCVAIEANVGPQEVKKGDRVLAHVDAKGKVLVESDLCGAGTSSEEKVGANGKVKIGNANGAGLFFIRLVASDESSTILCIAITAVGEQRFAVDSLQLQGEKRKPATTDPADAALLQKFADAVVKDHYAIAVSAAKKVVKEWATKHIVQSSATVTICILPVPGAQAVCVARIGDHLVELGFEFTSALVDECKGHGLDDTEAKTLLRWLQVGRTSVDLAKLLRADQTVDKVIEAASAGVSLTEFTVKDRGGNDLTVSAIGNNFVGLLDKAAVTIKVLKK